MTMCQCGHILDDHDQRTRDWKCRLCGCPVFRDTYDAGSVKGEPDPPPPVDVNGGAHELLARLNPDEPVFVIRAQDILAPQALAAYAALARKLGLSQHAQEVEARAVQMLAWQSAHAGLVKAPD